MESNRLNFLVRVLRENRATTIVVTLLLVLAATMAWNLLSPHADARLEAIRQKGYPVTLSELNEWYQAVPDNQNNARIYEQVFALPGFGNFDDIRWSARGGVLTARDQEQLAESVVANQAALRLLHSAQASNRCRYLVDLNKLFSPGPSHAFNVIVGVKLLGTEALWHAANGNSQQAVSSLLAAGLLADSEAEEPLLLAQIVRVTCWSITARRMEDAIALTQMTDDQLVSLQAMVAKAERPQALLRGLAGDRAMGIAAFAEPVNALADGPSPYSTAECLKADLIVGLSRTTGIFGRDRTFYLEAMGTGIAAASLPFPERLKLGQQTPGYVAAPRFSSISSRLLPRISSIFASEADMAARLRAAQVALAVECFRSRHQGRLPASLEELAPDFCKALPADPFDGKPLRLTVLDSGYAIYTSGTDARNGGPLGFQILWPGGHSH